ncbi:MAG TPA: NUDIX domain-containing protein [Streptosporangiaceae bacterium]
MADGPHTGQEVRAAGAVVWRPAAHGTEVALIHRPKYDDWSFPKGKIEPGEHVLLTAVREVFEETGLRVNLGRPLPTVRYAASGGVQKVVDYWVGQADQLAAPQQDSFVPGSEVDDLSWTAAVQAGARLTYRRDTETLRAFLAAAAVTVPLILLRHASAGRKSEWADDDVKRPLDEAGLTEARLLADMLRCFGTCEVISSPAERCLASVRPYAERAGVGVRVEPALGAPGTGDGGSGAALGEAAELAAELAGRDIPVIICGHRENLPALVDAACRQLGSYGRAAGDGPTGHGVAGAGAAGAGAAGAGVSAVGVAGVLEPGRALAKGEFLVLHRSDGRLAGAERHHPGGTEER